MSWQTEMVQIVRYLIDDLGTPPVYSSTRLESTIVIAAQLSLFELTFNKDYVIDVVGVSVTPDPTSDTKDNSFIILISLKAACIILGAEVKTAASESMRITDGPSTIDTTTGSTMKNKRYEDMCNQYDFARLQYMAGNSRNGAAIIGPYTNESVGILPWNF